MDLTKPESLGLYATRHFHLNYKDDDDNKVSVAAWHIVPNHIAKRFHKQLQLSPETLKNITNDVHYNANYLDDPAEHSYKTIESLIQRDFDLNDSEHKKLLFEDFLRRTKDPIVLYLHGNTGTRANGHRVDLYKTLRRLGYHVIAMDYRGFADSSNISPTEPGCVSDSLAMYHYIKNLTNSPVFVYGHSLGKDKFWDCDGSSLAYSYITIIYFVTSRLQLDSQFFCLFFLLFLPILNLQALASDYTWSRLSIKVTSTIPKV